MKLLTNKIMKTLKLLSMLLIATLASCSSVRVNADYDKKAVFTNFKSYAYLKNGIDKAEISDLDKKIYNEMQVKLDNLEIDHPEWLI
jgi:hypothetical protein